MRIESIIWLQDVLDKLITKHGVEAYEVEEVLGNRPRVRFVEKGHRQGENVYLALGQTDAGRYLAVVFIHKPGAEAFVLSARDMAEKERRQYGRK
jgi:uncharacterized DUF497 family protein